MKKMNYKYFATLLFGLASVSLADNPISTYHYLADPSAASDGDTFYILTDTDDYCVNSNPFAYNIVGLYGFSSKDMVNWTDHGMIFKSKREFGTYPSNTWASGIAVKNGKVYIVYPDASGGIGMITAPSIDGPYTDPVAAAYGESIHYIASNAWNAAQVSILQGCDGIQHCFDPGILIEDNGTGYVIFGGSDKEYKTRPIGNNFDIIKFTESNGKITFDKNSLTQLEAPNSFEAPYLHKYNGNYYLSFNNKDQLIGYGISKSVTGPYDYKGTFIDNTYHIDLYNNQHMGGNNHQGVAEFKGKWYAVYHDRRLAASPEHPASLGEWTEGDDQGKHYTNSDPLPANHRSVSINELYYKADGTIETLDFNKVEGPAQVGKFDPYQEYKALTSSKQRNVRSRTAWTKGKPVTHILLPLSTKESWIRVTGVDFKGGASKFTVTAGSPAAGNKVEVRTGSATGTLAGTCNIKQTSSKETYAKTECEMKPSVLKGVIDQLFLVFKGSADSTMGITHWEFTPKNGSDVGSSASTVNNSSSSAVPELTPRKPYGGKYVNAPGKIEAENFDIPGEGDANQTYYDRNEGNQSCVYDGEDACSHLREDTDVDLKKNGDGIVVGVFETDEWLEYSVYAAKGGSYTLYVAAVSETGGSLKFTVKDASGKVVSETDDIVVGESGGYDEYGKTTGATVTLAEGVNIIRMTCTKQYLDVDYFNLVAGENAADDAPIGVDVEPSYTPEEEISSSAGTEVKSSSSGKTDALGMHYMVGSMSRTYNVYDMQGVMLGKVQLDGVSASEALNRAGFRAGRYILCNKYSRLVVNAVDRH